MKLWATFAVLGLLVMGTWAQGVMPTLDFPPCDSPEAEAAALVAEDYLNAQHTHGYKYALNRIEKIKIISSPGQAEKYLLELDFLETTCHILDPTPLSQCPVRQKHQTAVEADCDFALSNTTQGLSVVAFKCQTETESVEDICLGCAQLIPLNDTDGLQLIQSSLDDFNKNHTLNNKFALFEIGRMASQVVAGVNKYFAEFAIIDTNCTSYDDDSCIPQNHTVAIHGFCLAEGSADLNQVDCKIFPDTTQDVNSTVRVQQPLHAHTSGSHHNPAVHSLKHHKLTVFHDPTVSGLISAESSESVEAVVPVAAPVVKREVAAEVPTEEPVPDASALAEKTPLDLKPVALVPICPGKKKHF